MDYVFINIVNERILNILLFRNLFFNENNDTLYVIMYSVEAQ